MLAVLILMGAVGASFGGYYIATAEQRLDSLPRKKKLENYPMFFPDVNRNGIYTVTHILTYLKMMPSRLNKNDLEPLDVETFEGDEMQNHHIKKRFWDDLYDLNQEFRTLYKSMQNYDKMKRNVGSREYQLYEAKIISSTDTVYKLVKRIHKNMEANRDIIKRDEELKNNPKKDYRTAEENALQAICDSDESTPEMKEKALSLLKELERMSPESYTNPNLENMELDIETIERMVKAKKL